MKLSHLALGLGISVCLCACQREAGALSPADRDAIHAASKAWVATYNENEWEALSEHFTHDATMMPPNGETVQGRSAIAAWERENEDGFQIAFELDEIAGAGNVAYVRGRSCVFIPDGAGGFGVDIGKFLEIRRRQGDGEWLIETDIFNSDLPMGAELRPDCPFAKLGDEPELSDHVTLLRGRPSKL